MGGGGHAFLLLSYYYYCCRFPFCPFPFPDHGLAPPRTQDVARAATEVREARTSQRHAELWLEKSLGEVDAVHAMLSYERSAGYGMAGGGSGGGGESPAAVQGSMCALPPSPPSPAFFGAGDGEGGSVCGSSSVEGGELRRSAAVGPTSQTPHPESLTQVLHPVGCGSGGGVGGVAASGSNGGKVGAVVGSPGESSSCCNSTTQGGSNLRTPDLDATCSRSLPFSAPTTTAAGTRSRSRLEGRETELRGDEMAATVGMNESSEGRGRGRGFGMGAVRGGGSFSPPTPTVLFGEPADGKGPTTTTARGGGAPSGAGMVQCDNFSKASGGKVNYNNNNIAGRKRAEDGSATFHLSQQLRLEVTRREKAEARIAALENAADAAAAASTVAAAAAQNKAAGMRDLAATRASEALGGRAGGNGEMCPRIGGPHHSSSSSCCGGGGGQHARFANDSVGGDACAYFAKLDHERQSERIAGLIREARTKMNPSKVGKGVGSRGGGGGHGRRMESVAPGGSFPILDRCRLPVHGFNSVSHA